MTHRKTTDNIQTTQIDGDFLKSLEKQLRGMNAEGKASLLAGYLEEWGQQVGQLSSTVDTLANNASKGITRHAPSTLLSGSISHVSDMAKAQGVLKRVDDQLSTTAGILARPDAHRGFGQ